MNTTATRLLFAFACVLIALATAFAAVGSHALSGQLDAAALHSFETAVHFQFFHALGLMALAGLGQRVAQSRLGLLAIVLIAGGVLLFCGGVYASSLDGPRFIARLAPSGGVALIVGWCVAAAAAWTTRPRAD